MDMILEYQKSIHCGCEVQELQSILGALLAAYPETLKQGSKEPELVRNGEVFFLPNQPVISKFQLKAFDMCESVCFF